MKEIKIFESWANSIIAERIEDRPLARSQDIQYQATRKYPDRTPEQAIAIYIADKMASSEKMDLDQNKLINAQKRENEKLTHNIQELGQELTNHERQAQDTGQEIERLKQLSSQLKPAGEVQQQLAKASADKVQAMLDDLAKIENKPGIDDNKFKELSDRVNKIKSQPVDNKEIAKVQATLSLLNQRQSVDDQLFDKVMGRLENTERELEAKEERFKKSLGKNAQKMGDWGNKFKDLDEKIRQIQGTSEIIFSDLGNKQAESEEMYTQSWATMKKTRELLKDMEETKDEQQDMIDRLFDLVSRLNPDAQQAVKGNVQRLAQLSTNMKDVEDKDEADLAKIPPEPVSGEELELSNPDDVSNTPDKSDEELAQDLASKLKSNTVQFPKSPEDRVNMQKKRMAEDLGKKYEEQPQPISQPASSGDWTTEELESGIKEMMELYKRRYPADFREYPIEAIRRVIRKSIGGSLLIYGDEITAQHIYKYLDRVQRILHKISQPTQPELPGFPRTNPRMASSGQFNMQESLMSTYEKQLSKLSGGW